MAGYDADVLVVGGGPGGLATAVHARGCGLSVIVIEPRATPVDKACGEGLMPGGLADLAAIGVDPAGMAFRGIAYQRGEQRVEAEFAAGPGRGVRRTTLHSALAARAEQLDTDWVSAKVTTVHQDADGVTAAGLRGRYLVGADGLHSAVRRGVGITAVAGTPRRYGVRRHYAVEPWSEFVEVHWSDWGEAYVTPVEPNLVGVAILSRGKPDINWFPWLAERLDGAGGTAERGCGPLRRVVSRRVAGRVLLVGDSAGYEDALTGEGMSLAFRQAGAAVAAIAADRPGDYERAWRQITRRYRVLTRALVLGTSPGFGRRAIVPGCAALPAAFRGAVGILGAH